MRREEDELAVTSSLVSVSLSSSSGSLFIFWRINVVILNVSVEFSIKKDEVIGMALKKFCGIIQKDSDDVK